MSFEKARELLNEFKGDNYVYGLNVFPKLGELVAPFGKKVAVVADGVGQDWAAAVHTKTTDALSSSGCEIVGDFVAGAAPNAPREDVFRMADDIAERKAEVVVVVGGGSAIDATKCAVAYLTLRDLYPNLDDYFGVGQVTKMLADSGRSMVPLIAVEIASASGAHLTKYSNITNMETGQKMLIVDEAVVPPKALFDYTVTTTMPKSFTMDGALDGIAHCLEVYYGVSGDALAKAEPVALEGIKLIVDNVKKAVENPDDENAREAIGLGTDLGGYAIMIGGTNGAHLNSFSLVDILSHGRACALMNPYYTVFFGPACEEKLRKLAAIYSAAGYLDADVSGITGRELGVVVAEAMLALSRDIGFPTTLAEVPGFNDEHIERCLTAAKNPKLASKLQNMPVPLSADTVDEYMGSVLAAAKSGDLSLIKNM